MTFIRTSDVEGYTTRLRPLGFAVASLPAQIQDARCKAARPPGFEMRDAKYEIRETAWSRLSDNK
jgi:hypothetical protein